MDSPRTGAVLPDYWRRPYRGSLSRGWRAFSPHSNIWSPVVERDVQRIEVRLTRITPSDVFGFSNVPEVVDGHRSCLRITEVKAGGLLAQWNKQFPHHSLVVGDRIIAVNDVVDDVAQMRSLLCGASIKLSAEKATCPTVDDGFLLASLLVESPTPATGSRNQASDGQLQASSQRHSTESRCALLRTELTERECLIHELEQQLLAIQRQVGHLPSSETSTCRPPTPPYREPPGASITGIHMGHRGEVGTRENPAQGERHLIERLTDGDLRIQELQQRICKARQKTESEGVKDEVLLPVEGDVQEVLMAAEEPVAIPGALADVLREEFAAVVSRVNVVESEHAELLRRQEEQDLKLKDAELEVAVKHSAMLEMQVAEVHTRQLKDNLETALAASDRENKVLLEWQAHTKQIWTQESRRQPEWQERADELGTKVTAQRRAITELEAAQRQCEKQHEKLEWRESAARRENELLREWRRYGEQKVAQEIHALQEQVGHARNEVSMQDFELAAQAVELERSQEQQQLDRLEFAAEVAQRDAEIQELLFCSSVKDDSSLSECASCRRLEEKVQKMGEMEQELWGVEQELTAQKSDASALCQRVGLLEGVIACLELSFEATKQEGVAKEEQVSASRREEADQISKLQESLQTARSEQMVAQEEEAELRALRGKVEALQHASGTQGQEMQAQEQRLHLAWAELSKREQAEMEKNRELAELKLGMAAETERCAGKQHQIVELEAREVQKQRELLQMVRAEAAKHGQAQLAKLSEMEQRVADEAEIVANSPSAQQELVEELESEMLTKQKLQDQERAELRAVLEQVEALQKESVVKTHEVQAQEQRLRLAWAELSKREHAATELSTAEMLMRQKLQEQSVELSEMKQRMAEIAANSPSAHRELVKELETEILTRQKLQDHNAELSEMTWVYAANEIQHQTPQQRLERAELTALQEKVEALHEASDAKAHEVRAQEQWLQRAWAEVSMREQAEMSMKQKLQEQSAELSEMEQRMADEVKIAANSPSAQQELVKELEAKVATLTSQLEKERELLEVKRCGAGEVQHAATQEHRVEATGLLDTEAEALEPLDSAPKVEAALTGATTPRQNLPTQLLERAEPEPEATQALLSNPSATMSEQGRDEEPMPDFVASGNDALELALQRELAALGPGCLKGHRLIREKGNTWKLGDSKFLLKLVSGVVMMRETGKLDRRFVPWVQNWQPAAARRASVPAVSGYPSRRRSSVLRYGSP